MNRHGSQTLPDESCLFSVWAPEKDKMILHVIHPVEQEYAMVKDEMGYFSLTIDGVNSGYKYFYRPDGDKDYPDPASHFQPFGIHGASQVINHKNYQWNDILWHGIPLKEMIISEIHVGTFSPQGTFEGILPYLQEIVDSGINTLEIMPVSQFPGTRNWGYDGVFPYAVQNSYGGPEGLKMLVDECHARGIAVLLDVVYNHLGAEGNYLGMFGPYFTKKYSVPWGDAINLDESWCDGVRDYFSDNPGHWFENYHIDGLRLDAIHTIYDSGSVHFWELTRQKIDLLQQKLGRRFFMVAESDTNSPKVVKPVGNGGFGFDAQWLDDFHHALYALLDKEGKSRYGDFGKVEQLVKAYSDGFVHSGEFVKFRKRKHGSSSAGIPGEKFVVFNQNHDQIGNRVKGERLSSLVDFEHLKLASAALFLSPYIPLLFMGEEYGEDNPFFYFISSSDQDHVRAVREGRKREFASFKWKVDPPDPQDESTFEFSRINFEKRNSGKYNILLKWNKELIRLRKSDGALQNMNKNDLRTYINHSGFILHRKSEDEQKQLLCFFNLGRKNLEFNTPSIADTWLKVLDSKEDRWMEVHDEAVTSLSSPGEIKACQTISIHGCSVVVYANK